MTRQKRSSFYFSRGWNREYYSAVYGPCWLVRRILFRDRHAYEKGFFEPQRTASTSTRRSSLDCHLIWSFAMIVELRGCHVEVHANKAANSSRFSRERHMVVQRDADEDWGNNSSHPNLSLPSRRPKRLNALLLSHWTPLYAFFISRIQLAHILLLFPFRCNQEIGRHSGRHFAVQVKWTQHTYTPGNTPLVLVEKELLYVSGGEVSQ